MPHIGLNAHLLSLGQNYRSAGISWYIYNLLQNLSDIDAPFQFSAFLSDRQYQPHRGLGVQRSKWSTRNPIIRILWEQLSLPFALKQQHINLLHALAFVAPVMTNCPFVTTVYDLSFMRYPEAFRPFNRWYLRTFTAHSSRRAAAIITISESTRRDVIDYFNIPAERVKSIHCGVDAAFRPLSRSEVEAFRVERGLPERFIFRLGTIEPRKNVEGVIRAYAAWRQRDPSAPKLFIGGGKGWYYQEAFALAESLGLADSVVFPGYLPQEELPSWYNAADLFVYPSFFEGFGLPVLEAMACGTPTITSDVSSLPEVAGDAAMMVSPTDTDALSRAMQTVFTDADLAQSMKEKGLAQAKKFSWQKTAVQTIDVYRQVLG